MKVGFIGAGNMAGAIIQGMVTSGHSKGEDICCFDVDKDKTKALAEQCGVVACPSNEALVEASDLVVLAVKPLLIEPVLTEVKDLIVKRRPLIVSIAAGTTIPKIESILGKDGGVPVVRVMPNLNVMVGEGMSAVCGNAAAGAEGTRLAQGIFDAVGRTVEIAEKDFSVFTAIAGSAPAFVFLFIDALARGGVKNGLPKQMADRIAAQAVLGSAKTVLQGEESPWGLIDKVCSPGGTTVAGLMALEDQAFLSTVVKGVEAAIARDREMMKQ